MTRSIIKLFYLSDENLTVENFIFLKKNKKAFKFQVSIQATIMQPKHLKNNFQHLLERI